jgi:hypothetical protein
MNASCQYGPAIVNGSATDSFIDVTSPAWAACRTAVLDLAR